jgi:hypothetical protein
MFADQLAVCRLAGPHPPPPPLFVHVEFVCILNSTVHPNPLPPPFPPPPSPPAALLGPDPDPQHWLLNMYCNPLFVYPGDAVPLLPPTQDGRCGGSTQGRSLYYMRRNVSVV